MQTYSLLLVEDNQADADFIQRVLRSAEDARFDVSVVGWLNSALMAVGAKSYDAVLLDLSLPDSQGLDTVVAFTQKAPDLPIIVMTGHDDMTTGVNAVRYGAQDYLIKGDVTYRPLPRSIIYAIERKRADLTSKNLIRESISNVTSAMPVSDEGPSALVRHHAEKFSSFLFDLRQYVGRNAPAHAEPIESIINNHQLDVVLREVQALTRPDSRRTQPGMPAVKRISDTALEKVKAASGNVAVPPSTAQDTLLGAIRSATEIGTRYGDGGDDQ